MYENVKINIDIFNTDRTFGTILGSEITRRYKTEGLPEDTVWVKGKGTAGQSFGAFIPNGLTLEVEGDGNDYVINGTFRDIIIYFIAGIVEGIGTIIPGISSSAMLMVMGVYNIFIYSISNMFSISFIISNFRFLFSS